MPRKFYLRHVDTVIGIITETPIGLMYEPTLEAEDVPFGLGYPLGIYPLDPNSPDLMPDKSYIPDSKNIKLWLEDRVFPRDRAGASGLLKSIGLGRYDEWEIAKYTKAITNNDDYWISDNLSDKYFKIHPRSMLPGNLANRINNRKKIKTSKLRFIRNLMSKMKDSNDESSAAIEDDLMELSSSNFFSRFSRN